MLTDHVRTNLPGRPIERVTMTKRALGATQSVVSTVAKAFNALEVILLFQVFISGCGELLGRQLSWGWYLVLLLTLSVNIYLRVQPKPTEVTVAKAKAETL